MVFCIHAVLAAVRQKVPGLIVQLFIQLRPDVSLVAKGWATFGSAHQGKMNARFRVVLAQNPMFQGIQRDRLAEELDDGLIPRAVEDAADVLDALDWVMIGNEAQRVRVVGVDEKRELLFLIPLFEVGFANGGDLVQVTV